MRFIPGSASRAAALLAASGAWVLACAAARADFAPVAIKAVALQQIHSPTTITHAPDGSGRLFVCDQLGKILRIDPIDSDGAGPLAYTIPADNPFYRNLTPGLKKEIYAFGLRNPWRFSFDQREPSGTDRLFCGDVGQGRIEEINLIVAGGNYGWRYKEGLEFPTFSSGNATDPMPDPGLDPYIDPIAM